MLRLLAVTVAALFVAGASAHGSGSGIRGRVVAGPTCPVEREPPDPRCAPRGFAARVRIYRLSDRRTVARRSTGADGRFTVTLRPGRYAVSARPSAQGSLPSCPPPVTTRVRAGTYTRLVVECDSGIR